jgi:iron complex transport system substrate-binding protein
MRYFFHAASILLLLSICISCKPAGNGDGIEDVTQPRFLQIIDKDGAFKAVSVSPFDGSRDTLAIDGPLDRLIVMSTSHIGFLEAIGRTGGIAGVSGLDYVYSQDVDAVDVGYDASPDYEKIVSLKPDLLLTYSVSAAKSPFISKLEQLGIRVFTVNEHLESHPLARASYVRLFGALTGTMDKADSVLDAVRSSYTSLADSLATSVRNKRKVLLNIPYNDQWFVPSESNYLTAMIRDAGGEVLGCEDGRTVSSVMSVEKAYSLSKEADCWMNVGWCSTMRQLLSVNPVFGDMAGNIRSNADAHGYAGTPVIWNDNRRLSPKGGNDIWESGVARPDLLLRDIASILHPSPASPVPTYYLPLD